MAPRLTVLFLFTAAWACAPDGETMRVPALSDLAAAAIVDVLGADDLTTSPLTLATGRLPSAFTLARRAGTRRFLLTVDGATLRSASLRADSMRFDEARILAQARESCPEDGDILEGVLSFAAAGRVRVFEARGQDFEELSVSESLPSWLERFRAETPALDQLDCGDGLELELTRVFPEEQAFPRTETVEGQPQYGELTDLVDVAVLSDGRVAAIDSFSLGLRAPDQRYADDPLQVRRIYAGSAEGLRPRGALFVKSEDGRGNGELWFVSRDEVGAVQLEALQFDREGLRERRVLSRIPVVDIMAPRAFDQDVAMLFELPSGALAGVTLSSVGIYAPGPEGPWTTQRIGADLTRSLIPLPTAEPTFAVANQSNVFLWRPLNAPEPVRRIGEFPLYQVLAGYGRETADGVEIGIVGSRGLYATNVEPFGVDAWRNRSLDLPPEASRTRRCAGPVTCGRSRTANQIWDAQEATWGSEPWLMFGVDGCTEIVLSRLRDQCPRFVELDSERPAGLDDANTRRILQRRGRWFQLGGLGDLREMVQR